jgi:hypothetical protein
MTSQAQAIDDQRWVQTWLMVSGFESYKRCLVRTGKFVFHNTSEPEKPGHAHGSSMERDCERVAYFRELG